jgi:hypothetical protein
MSDRHRIRHRPRRPATAAERRQAREVARFVYARHLADQPLPVTLAIISGAFPEISLDSALTGYVFRSLLASPRARSLLELPARGCA